MDKAHIAVPALPPPLEPVEEKSNARLDDGTISPWLRRKSGVFRTPCHLFAIKSFVRAFGIAYGLRSCLAVALRALTLTRTKGWRSVFSLSDLVGEKSLVFREEAVRWGLCAGFLVGGTNYAQCLLQWHRGVEKFATNSLIAGAIGGLSLLFLEKDTQRTVALYTFVRLLQSLYNWAKARGHVKPVWNGDALLFALSSAQIMYAYVMRPDTLPPSFFNFILRTGPIDSRVLDAVRANCRATPFNPEPLAQYIKQAAPAVDASTLLANALPDVVPCSVLHPANPYCTSNSLNVFFDSFRKVFPLYCSLSFVPLVALRLIPLLRNPVGMGGKTLLSAVRSTTFLASFVALYQATVCTSRKLFSTDHKIVYFLAGLVCSSSILIERHDRRAELALYTLPRGADSLYIMLQHRKWLGSVPLGEVMLFMMATSGLFYFFNAEPKNMSPLMLTAMKLLFRR